MTSIYVIIALVAVAGAAVYISYKLGKATAAKKQAEGVADEREEDAEIASGPFVDDPVSLMRGKEK